MLFLFFFPFSITVSHFATCLFVYSPRPTQNVYEGTKTVFFLSQLHFHHNIKRDVFTTGLLPFILATLHREISKTWSQCRKAFCPLGLTNYASKFNIIFPPLPHQLEPQTKSISPQTLRSSPELRSRSRPCRPLSPFAVGSAEAADAPEIFPCGKRELQHLCCQHQNCSELFPVGGG